MRNPLLELCLLAALLPLGLLGCEPFRLAGSGAETESAVPGQPFELALGEAALVEAADLRIAFEELVEDSRCPRDVDCVWAGRAQIRLTLRDGGQQESALLTIPGSAHSGDVDHVVQGDYRVRFLELLPEPVSSEEPEADDYRARLIVERI